MSLYTVSTSNTTLLMKAIADEDWNYVLDLVNLYPSHCKKQVTVTVEGNKTNMLPLHRACCRNPSVNIVSALLRHYPKAIRKSDSHFNRLPLHFACIKSADEDVIRELLNAFPEGAHQFAMNGRFPLHYACANGSSPGVVDALLEYYPEGARTADKFGMLPIHLACLHNAPIKIIKGLLNVFPESLYYRTNKGNNVIACAKAMPDCANKNAVMSVLDSATKTGHSLSTISVPVRTLQKVESGEFC